MKKKKKLASVEVETIVSPSIISSSTQVRPTMALQGVKGFLASLKEYHNSDALSDIVVTCEGQEFKAHRVILSAHSNVFATALNGNWKESSERKIDIKDFDPSVVEAMLRFIYSLEYSNTYGTSSMVFDAQMWQIADKYDIQALKAESKKKFEIAVATGWSMEDFPTAVAIVYEAALPGLREIAVRTANDNIEDLIKKDGFCELMRATPHFTADLVQALCDKALELRNQYECPDCKNMFQMGLVGKVYYCPLCSHQPPDWTPFKAS
ncbi:n-carbamoyl-l-amino acid hydrolase [Fusarium pseudoanthophilum]|uniref:N-carbamoyl-l-amino acid hydrolase n=1 Tax=Fusarium pseudoanthophilum TaxID=48495 RepID=A0A8H5P3Y3_9HYPO|nr:n-carbamoyl-l-amino acid hydrolase [Fusarium pseudoanthophilum]